MKIAKVVTLALVFCSLSIAVQAQVPELIKNSQFREDAQAAVDSLYNFNSDGAEQRLAEWKEKYPSHPLWKLMDGIELWWTLLSDLNDHSRDERFYEMMEKADYAASKLLYKQPGHADALIIRTVANGYVARQHSNRDEWVTSLNSARKAYKSYGYLKDNMPNFPDLKLADGLKLYYSEYLPEAYPVVKTVSWFLPDGDKKKGLKKMRKASETAIFARAEATYFLGNINHNYENNYKKAAQYFESLYESYPNNNYYARLLVKNYYEMHRYDDALTVIDSTLKRWEARELPFHDVLKEELLFWKGRILYRRGAIKQALPLLKQSFQLSKNLPRSHHRNYYPASAYYAGMILSRMNQNDEAADYFKAVVNAEAGEGYKEHAQTELNKIRSRAKM